MPAQSQAQTAIKSLNGRELLGKEMSVKEARPRADQGRTGGDEWIIAAAGTVTNSRFSRKEADPCCSEEGMDGSMLQDQAI